MTMTNLPSTTLRFARSYYRAMSVSRCLCLSCACRNKDACLIYPSQSFPSEHLDQYYPMKEKKLSSFSSKGSSLYGPGAGISPNACHSLNTWVSSLRTFLHMQLIVHKGTRIHPLSSQLIPHVHSLTLPESYEWILLVANCAVIVKTQRPQYPSSLLSFFSSLLDRPTPRPRYDEEAEGPQQTSNENVDDGPNKTPQQGDKPGNTTLNSAATRFLGTPNFNMNVNVKWAWPNYLSFGARKASSAIPITSDATVETSTSKHSEITITEPSEPASHSTEIDSHTVAPTHDNDDEKSLASSHTRSASRISAIDSIALEDALTSDNITLASSADSRPSSPAPDTDFSTSPPDVQSDDSHGCADGEALARTIVLEPKCDTLRAIETEAGASSITSPIRPVALSEDMKASAGNIPIQVTIPPEPEPQTIPSPPRVSFSFVRVYLPTITDSNEPTILKRRQVFYIKVSSLCRRISLTTFISYIHQKIERRYPIRSSPATYMCR